MKIKLSASALAISLAFSASSALAKEVVSTTDAMVSQSECVVSEQEISIVGGAVSGAVGGAGGAFVGRVVGGRTGGWVGGLVGSAVGGVVGSKGRSTYDCSVLVENKDGPRLVRSITHNEVKSGDSVQLHSLSDGTYHISKK